MASKVVSLISSMEEYHMTNAFVMELFFQVFQGSPVAQNRLGWPGVLTQLTVEHTFESVMSFDREIRQKNPGGYWNHQDLLAQALLVKSKNTPVKSPNSKKKKKKGAGAGKKLAGTCRAAERGDECRFGVDCKFSHVHKKCGKDNKHVWADCV